jgi:hypothetical protein
LMPWLRLLLAAALLADATGCDFLFRALQPGFMVYFGAASCSILL